MRISVLMGVYREPPRFIHEAIDSILEQTYSDFEFIIVLDDPDNEEALAILRDYEKQDNRVSVLVNDRNIGLAMSLNRALELVKGEMIARMDADDISLPERFQIQLDYMDKHPGVSVLGTNKIIIDEEGNELSRGSHLPVSAKENAQVLRYANVMVHSSVMIRTEDIKKINGYRDIPTTQDFDLWLRFVTSGMKIHNINQYLLKYRINSQGVSMSKAYKQALVAVYMRKLEKQRLENHSNTDSYSKESLERFFQKNKVDDPVEAQKYQKAKVVFEEGFFRIKNKHYITGGFKLFQAAMMHPLMRWQVSRTAKGSIIKRSIIKRKAR